VSSSLFPQFSPISQDILKRDPRKIGISTYLQYPPAFYRSTGTFPTKDGLIINVESIRMLFLNLDHLVTMEDKWKNILDIVVQYNLPIDLNFNYQSQIENSDYEFSIDEDKRGMIAERICSLGRYIWRIHFLKDTCDEGMEMINRTLEINPTIWKNVFCLIHGVRYE